MDPGGNGGRRRGVLRSKSMMRRPAPYPATWTTLATTAMQAERAGVGLKAPISTGAVGFETSKARTLPPLKNGKIAT